MILYRTGKEIRRYVERIVDEEQQEIFHSGLKLFNTKAYLLDKLECIDEHKTYEIEFDTNTRDIKILRACCNNKE